MTVVENMTVVVVWYHDSLVVGWYHDCGGWTYIAAPVLAFVSIRSPPQY